MVLSGSYPNLTCLNSTFPFNLEVSIFPLAVISSSGSSKNSKILSAAAIMACNILEICANWLIGWVNCLLYCIKLCIFPTVIVPWIAKYPPATATATYPTFDIKFITGCINPDKNCDFQPEWYNSSFAFSKSLVTFSSALNTFTIFKPLYISSTCPFTCPK